MRNSWSIMAHIEKYGWFSNILRWFTTFLVKSTLLSILTITFVGNILECIIIIIFRVLHSEMNLQLSARSFAQVGCSVGCVGRMVHIMFGVCTLVLVYLHHSWKISRGGIFKWYESQKIPSKFWKPPFFFRNSQNRKNSMKLKKTMKSMYQIGPSFKSLGDHSKLPVDELGLARKSEGWPSLPFILHHEKLQLPL